MKKLSILWYRISKQRIPLRKSLKSYRGAILLFFVFVFLSGCTKLGYVKKSYFALGTVVEITVADADKPPRIINAAIRRAFAEIKRVESLLSKYKADSDIYRINTNANIRPTKVSAETITLIERARRFSQYTEGAFDITIYPLMEIWGFSERGKKGVPTDEELNRALTKVGYQYINIIKDRQSVFLTQQGMSLDLGGLAKGYAVDQASQVLKQEGIKSALINAGGDIYALGRPDKRKGWQVALQHPRKKDTFLTTLEIQDQAVATSGDYLKFIEIDGRRYSHIINPKTGIPCENVPCSVTVIAKDCLSADALATALFVLGASRGIDSIDRLEDTEAIVVNFRDGKLDILLSRGLQGEIKL